MRDILSRILLVLLLLSAGSHASEFQGCWFYSVGDCAAEAAEEDDKGIVSAKIAFPGAGLIFMERDRKTMRPAREDFTPAILSIDVKHEGKSDDEVKAVIFVKDKDGHWFQSQKVYHLMPGKWQTLSVGLAGAAKELTPVGHMASWSSLNAVTIHSAGINVFSKSSEEMTFHCRNLKRLGTRPIPKLTVYNWEKPSEAVLYQTVRGRFDLSREYFNPFDAEEIKVDIEARSPNGETLSWPAFFTQDYQRKRRFNEEMLVPVGTPYWAYRFTPDIIGSYSIRLSVDDNTPGFGTSIKTPWSKINISPSEDRGFVRISNKDHRYFEFCNGEFFYPIGFNLHSVKDLRSEQQLKLGYQPDVGTYSYDEYLDAMGQNGINSVEIWMAAWCFAIEWTSARTNYHGMGRYNLANAWRLDHVLDTAADNGMYVHLVLDNHGKLATRVDPEWDNSPHNQRTQFAKADGAHLERCRDFFTDETSWRYYKNRNRYIAGRWGPVKNIFGMELWSEIDLVDDHKSIYESGTTVEWHKKAARHLLELLQGKHLITTHTCGDYNKNLEFRKYFELEEIKYVVGDAYRNNTHFIDHMLTHVEKLRVFGKPMMITEYGGSPHGNTYPRLQADLHAGLWASLFTEQAGTPYLWWHDFIHKVGHYQHFYGFASFMQGIDPRGKKFAFSKPAVVVGDSKPADDIQALLTGNQEETYIWIFKYPYMLEYPSDKESLPWNENLSISLSGLKKGTHSARFFDTLTGEENDYRLIFSDFDQPVQLSIPPFKIDLACKIRWQGSGKLSGKVIKAD
ncbi:MAG: hypothetical protein JW808_08290 [Victivallales bacterium]|nr:hypothetical protein [Victivallales bacterium]